MKSRFILSLLAAAAAVCMVGFTAGTAMALHNAKATMLVPAGLAPDSVRVIFTGANGTIAGESATPTPNVTDVVGGDTVNVAWASKLAPGDTVTIKFTCQHAVKGVASGSWSNSDTTLAAVDPDSVSVENDPIDPVPGASPMVILMIAVVIAGAGVLMLRRRAEA